jgi:predicted DNA-binding transcriptional regulator AlpA
MSKPTTRPPTPTRRVCDDPLETVQEVAERTGTSVPSVWRQVQVGRLPAPLYPAPRAPRWRRSEIDAALEATRALPRDAMAARRAARLGIAPKNNNPAA